jgi:8-amino-7-oxononanoate synthase
MGYHVLGGGTPIVPVVIGGSEETLKLASYLMESGFYAPAIRPPTVPENECRLRLTVSALHTRADIEALMDVFRKA